ncbi:MAG: glycosyltransferase family 39 protein [Gemmatimonadota bacterium]|nr:glycosyltransferase family 39 protein [Gemmatimonadota bacterium]
MDADGRRIVGALARSPLPALVGIVFVLALSLRLVHAFQMSASPLFTMPAVDAATYAEQAASLAEGNWLGRGQGPFWQPPLYPYFLGVIKLAFPESFFYVSRFAQALIGSLTCVLLYLVGRRLFGPSVGFIGGLIAAVYGPLIYFDARLLPAGLATFFTLVSLLLLIRAVERPTRSIFTAAGFALGLASLTAAILAPLIPGVAIWLFYWLRKKAAPAVVAFLLGAILAIAPVTLRNYTIGGDFVPISYNGGVNFYIGNNANAEQTLALRPGWEWEGLVALPLREGITRPSSKSLVFYRQALEYIQDAPLNYMGLLAAKTAQFWRGDEIERNQEMYYWRKYSSVLAGTLWKSGVAFPFGLISPLALLGLIVYIRRQGIALPVLFVLGYSLAVISFFVTARYRLPIVPLLILFAAYGGNWLYARWRQQSLRQALLPTAVLALLVLLVNWDLPPMDERGKAATHNDLGNAYLQQGRYDLALLKYEQATRLDSTYWQAWFNLGSLRAMRGDLRGALPILLNVLEHERERADVWSNVAGVYVGLGQYQQAAEVLEQGVVAAPREDLYEALENVYAMMGKPRRGESEE